VRMNAQENVKVVIEIKLFQVKSHKPLYYYSASVLLRFCWHCNASIVVIETIYH